MADFTIPYGTETLTFSLDADLAESNFSEVAPAGLQLGTIDPGAYDRALIIFTDATRHAPDRWFAEKLLAALPFPPDRIRFLCAIGMHRPSTHEEKIAKLGAEIVSRYEVIDHDPAKVVTVGEIDGIPVEVNPLLIESGTMLICTGVVEPHQYAGYSGGAKTAVIGCGGAQTIGLTHGAAMLDRDGVLLGKTQNNPFQEFVRKAGALIGVDYVINAVMPDPYLIAAAGFGGIAIHDGLVNQARHYYEVKVPNPPYDVVIAGVGSPKDANLYQASRAATYIGLSGSSVLRWEGVIIVPALLPEGAGSGAGERNFFEILQRFGATRTLIDHLRKNGCRPGEQRAYMIAQLLEKAHCIIVGARDPAVVKAAGLDHAKDIEEALNLAQAILQNPEPKILIVPHALQTLPIP